MESAIVQDAFARAYKSLEAKIADLQNLAALQLAHGDDPAFTELLTRKAEILAQQTLAASEALRARYTVTGNVREPGTPLDVWVRAEAIAGARAADAILAQYGLEPAVRFDPERVISLTAEFSGLTVSPFAHLYDAGQRRALRDILVGAATSGTNPRAIAGIIRDTLGIGETRALTTARTETLRAMRAATLTRYADAPAVDGWIWISARDSRTCAFCWSMHGSVHSLDEPMATHPNCRCSQAPQSSGDELRPNIPTGTEEFAKLSDSAQRRILGPGAYRLFKAGTVNLDDFRGLGTHPVWGRVGYRRSLREIMASKPAANVTAAKEFAKNVNPATLAELRAEFPDLDDWIGEVVRGQSMPWIDMADVAKAYNLRKAYAEGVFNAEARQIARKLGLTVPVDPDQWRRPEAMPKLPPADDLAAFEAYLTSHPELSKGGFYADLGHFDPVVRGLTGRELVMLAEKFPSVAEWLKGFGSWQARANSRAWAHYKLQWRNAPGERTIEFSNKWAGDFERFTRSTKQAADQLFHGPGTGISDVLVHEYGHAIQDRLGWKAIETELGPLFRKMKRAKTLPTEYARDNTGEAFAEAFVEIWNGRTDNAWVRAVKEVLDKNEAKLLR